jgi:transposase InsO family protein
VLREVGVVEQRYQAVREVLNDGASVTDVARRNGISRQTVHEWLLRYANRGLPGLMDRSSKPQSCPHQMSPVVEARIVELRTEHPGWGPRTLMHRLGLEGFDPVPGRTSIYRCLIRHGLITPEARRRRRADYKRWERSRAMDLWQMDVLGGVRLVDGSDAMIITGIDDHSRFCVSASVVARATARPTCEALALALRNHGAPSQILSDNGKVFTSRFNRGAGEVMFDRMCRDHGIGHLLTAPRSPTTTGKVERFHKTLRREFLAGKTFVSIDVAQAELDAWVHHYNFERPHQSLGMAVPWDRFRLVKADPVKRDEEPVVESEPAVPTVTRRVGGNGLISFAATHYRAGVWLAGENVTVICEDGLVQLHHRGVLVATHARRHRIDKQTAGLRRGVRPAKLKRSNASAASVTRKVDGSGNVCFAGTNYRAGVKFSRRQVQVALVGETVEISIGSELIRSHPIRHDRTREHGALANPGGRPRRINAA